MGLFDIFKKKKEEKVETVDNNGQVQVQPEGVQIVNNDQTVQAPIQPVTPVENVVPVEPVPAADTPNEVVSTPVPASFVPDNMGSQVAQPEIDAGLVGQEFVKSDPALTGTIDMNATTEVINTPTVPKTMGTSGENVGTMNEMVDNSSPTEVLQINTNDEKNISQDIVPAVEDVAALIDNPIPAKSEQDSMSANPEEIIGGGEENFEWQNNPFTEVNVNDEDNVNLIDNIISNDQNVISHNNPINVQSFETIPREDDIKDLSNEVETEKVDSEQVLEMLENKEDEVETIPEEDTVITVEDDFEDKGIGLEQSNIFKDNTVDYVNNDEFVPIVVDETEDDEEEAFEKDNDISTDQEEKVDINILNTNQDDTSIDKIEVENIDEGSKDLEEDQDITKQEEDNKKEEIDKELPILDNMINKDTEQSEKIEEEPKEESKDEEIILPSIVEDKKENIEVEEEYEGPVIEEEKTFTIFDLPPISMTNDEVSQEENIEISNEFGGILEEKEEGNGIFDDEPEQGIFAEDNNYLDDSKEKEESEEQVVNTDEEEYEEEKNEEEQVEVQDDNIADMYSQLEFKNERIRFCDNCGAMILGDAATVCPSCGEPL